MEHLLAKVVVWCLLNISIVFGMIVESGRHKLCAKPKDATTVYDFQVKAGPIKFVNLTDYKGNVLLIVNTATFCGLTWQYNPLNELQNLYKDEDFVILGFPCNNFGLQEPGDTLVEILNGLKYVRPGNNYQPNFPLFEKIKVNGREESPLYTYLKELCPTTQDEFSDPSHLYYLPLRVHDIRWNFEKFLIDSEGNPVKRYHSAVHPLDIREDIKQLLLRPKKTHYSYLRG